MKLLEKLKLDRRKKKLVIKFYRGFWKINSLLPENFQVERVNESRGAPSDAQRIEFEEIRSILNCDTEGSENFTSSEYENWVKGRVNFLKIHYGIRLEDKVVIKTIGDHTTCLIRDLCLLTEPEAIISFKPKFFIHYEFMNNTFLYRGDYSKSSIIFELYGYGITNFKNNKFQNTELILTEDSSTPHRQVNILNNDIFAVGVTEHANVFFMQGNRIRKGLTVTEGNKEGNFGVIWSPYEKVDIRKEDVTYIKDSFLTLIERAERRGDKFQEAILRREILKCENVLFYSKEGKASKQDRLILWFGNAVSNHGISWIRPIGFLVGFNMFLSFIIFAITGIGYILGFTSCVTGFWYVLAGMFNPISNLAQTTGIDNAVILFANALQKAVFALLVYELIRVGRRFVAK